MLKRFFFIFFLISCKTDTPKPKSYLLLKYPDAAYKTLKTLCNYEFEINSISTPIKSTDCSIDLDYKPLKGNLYLTYFDLSISSYKDLQLDFRRRIEIFSKNASRIDEKVFENTKQNIFGKSILIVGTSPSNLHFFVTDKKKNFLTGSLIFKAQPNFDSLRQPISYIEKDIKKIIETIRWN